MFNATPLGRQCHDTLVSKTMTAEKTYQPQGVSPGWTYLRFGAFELRNAIWQYDKQGFREIILFEAIMKQELT